jgi:hypothetical protein
MSGVGASFGIFERYGVTPAAPWAEEGFGAARLTVSDRRIHATGLKASMLASIKTEQSASVRNQTARQALMADKMINIQKRDRFRALAACSSWSGSEFSWHTSISRQAQSWFADSRRSIGRQRKRPPERGNIDFERGKCGCDYEAAEELSVGRIHQSSVGLSFSSALPIERQQSS